MPTLQYHLTPKQEDAQRLIGSRAQHILLRGGARSGKTFIFCRAVIVRAIKAPASTHAVLRLRFNHLKDSIIYDTMPKVARLCFPELPSWQKMTNKSDWITTLPNGSKILYGGLDDKDRTEKILGQEHSTLYFNECSQIGYGARNKGITRLAQNSGLKLKAYYDCNPPTVGHWTYRMFEKKLEPLSGALLTDPDNYVTMMMNPADNLANLPPEYIATLESLPEKDKLRFLMGQYLAQVDGALWTMDTLDKRRLTPIVNDEHRDAVISRMRRICVAVDPSGCQGPEDVRSDEVGITVTGTDYEGQGYVLADLSGRYGPEQWGRLVVGAYDAWQADTIVAETNYGGAMVVSNIRSACVDRAMVPVEIVTASRGKFQRAQPVAALYTQGKVTHVGAFPDLEDQMCNFAAAGYQGPRSPDRADSVIWGLTHLMIGGQKSRIAFGNINGE